ncbi:beta-carotene 15 15 monooxygenase [Fusarium phyllophilum]|uniref:Beta-carotene 15 15 monooxygenase n=1 Tax=Fusarium phyllophilum TaxID=47803 RepID=A0A8H5JPC4_9HYPO|nr:beta-carotene 15 15 monooxygenase [Fusarium phyllophilum]
MAHIFDVAPLIDTGYIDGKKVGTQVKYPDTGTFSGFNKPFRLEGDIFDLEVSGTIPSEINGTFYRVQPDHRFPPVFEDDIHFNGDGNITAIRIQNSHADYKQRYVRTDRFLAETKERRSLFGRYRNPFTDSELVKSVIRTSANTNITFWRGMLLASKEDGPPYAMDPVTLETIGRYDFEGQIQSPTMTAHPKFDPETGEMICFAYEAGGNGNDGSRQIAVWTIDANGVKTEEAWYEAPFCGMIHDCGISKNYIVLPMTPLKCNPDRLQKGGNHWAWDPKEDQWYGVVPRRNGKPEDIIWFRSDNGEFTREYDKVLTDMQSAFHGHVAGCYENEDGNIVFDLTVADGNVFFFFPPEDTPAGTVAKRNRLNSPTKRWIFDPKSPSGTRVQASEEWDTSGEFSRIDDRYVTKKYNHFWQAKIDGAREYNAAKCGSPAGGLFNCLAHYTWDERTEDIFWAGSCATFQEPSFIPKKDGGEGEGWLIALLNHLDVLRNDVVIFDAQNLAAGPVATIHLPMKLRLGLHGNFVDQADIEEWQARRQPGGDVGPVRPAEKPLPWQSEADST